MPTHGRFSPYALGLVSSYTNGTRDYRTLEFGSEYVLFQSQTCVVTRSLFIQTVSLLRTFYFLTIGFAKNAILLEWKTIFVPHPVRNAFYWTCWGLVIVNTLYYIAVITTTHLYCIPFDAAWQPWTEGHCINQYVADVIILSFNLFTDLVILILPQRIIWTLQMRKQRRLGIAVLFSLGLMWVITKSFYACGLILTGRRTCACAAGRVQAVVAVDYNGDAEYGVDKVILWGVGELTGLLIVFCVPAAPKAFDGEHKWLHKIKQSLLSWSFSTKALLSSTSTRLPPRESSSGFDVYERMNNSSQVELTHIQRDLKGKQAMTQ